MNQRGAALLTLMTALLIAGLGFMLVKTLDPQARLRAQDEATDLALANAKAALIGYAVTTKMSGSGPGNLLCPDGDNDGTQNRYEADGSGPPVTCSGSSRQALRLGRIPWATLGHAEVLDGNGERLWYAVSDNFRNLTASRSNSDSTGTITVRDASGRILYDGSNGNGVAAVIIAPGPPLAESRLQQRPGNNAIDYLDLALGEDNANFRDGTTDGFIMGPVRSSNGQIIANDRLVVITRDELLAATEKRIAGELRNCLMAWAEINNDQFPPPAPINSTDYLGIDGNLFGRIPKKLTRNHARGLAIAIARLETARAQFINSSPQTRHTATLAIARASRNLTNAISPIVDTMGRLKSLDKAADIKNLIDTSGIDPMLNPPNQGRPLPASEMAADTTLETPLKDGVSQLADTTGGAKASAEAASAAARRLLTRVSAEDSSLVEQKTQHALDTLKALVLVDRNIISKTAWSSDLPDCSWLDQIKSSTSGWASNEWINHVYYQIDQPSLMRNADDSLASGSLSVSGRSGYQLVVIAAGRAIGTQSRANTFDPAQHFEGINAHPSRNGIASAPSKLFEHRPPSNTFNDQLAY